MLTLKPHRYTDITYNTYHYLSKQRNCSTPRIAARAASSGVASPMMPASSMTHASAKALVAFPLLNLLVHLGLTSLTIGIVSSHLVSSYTPILHSLTLGQR